MAVEGQGLGFRRSIGTVIMAIDQSINIGTVIMAQVRGGTVSGNVIDIALKNIARSNSRFLVPGWLVLVKLPSANVWRCLEFLAIVRATP